MWIARRVLRAKCLFMERQGSGDHDGEKGNHRVRKAGKGRAAAGGACTSNGTVAASASCRHRDDEVSAQVTMEQKLRSRWNVPS